MRSTAKILSVLVLVALMPVSPALAQEAESFFDIFTEVDGSEEQCDPCQAILDEIEWTQKEIEATKIEIGQIDRDIKMLEDSKKLHEEAIKEAQKSLDELNNPKSSAESEGRKLDSSDLAAMQRRADTLWKQYKRGRLSAQEYSDEIAKPFDDPEVAADLKLIKEIMKGELQESIESYQKVIKTLEKSMAEMSQKASELTDYMDELLDYLETLMSQLAECRKRCAAKEDASIDDFEIQINEESFWESMKRAFDDFFGTVPLIPGLDEEVEKLGGGISQQEIDDLPMPEMPTIDLGVDFSEIFKDLKLPPVCHLCDPIRNQIIQDEAELAALEAQQATLEAMNKENWADYSKAQKLLNNAKRALEAFDNPPASGESEGRHVDSTDHAAMKVRNAGLWADYKAGNLSAQELSDEWGRDISDPALQKELAKIKKEMRQELEQAVKDAEEAIENVNKWIKATDEKLIELAGTIAGRKVMLDYLYKDLAECEKKCLGFTDDMQIQIGDWDKFIFPEDDDDDGEDEQSTSAASASSRSEAAEEVKVPQECVRPAVPMSQCQQTCHTTCTKSGVRAWQEGNTVKIEDCGICPPMHLDMCPTGMFFEKAQCETDGKCECEVSGKSTDGADCFACKKKEKGWVCSFPLIGGWLCDDEGGEEEEDDDWDEEDENVSAASSRSEESRSSREQKESASASSQRSQEKSTSKSSRTSSATSTPGKCDTGTMASAECEKSCSGTCSMSYEEFDGLKCYKCIPGTTAKEKCDAPTETEAECRKECFGSCVKSYTRSDGVKCFECVAEQKSSSTSQTYTQPHTSSSSKPQTVSCPSGKVADKASCESQCSAQGGTCVQDGGCYGCVVVNCPEGTYKNACPSSCEEGCDTVGSQDGVSCYQCKQSCEDVCVRNGYDPPGTDYTGQVLSTLNGYSCVSGASVSITTGTIGACTCTKSPNVTVNQTPPVCTGTTCGDVACGQSATCSPEPNTTVTVRCNWGGWKDLGNLRFQPVIGQ